jgi:hypothetical protein
MACNVHVLRNWLVALPLVDKELLGLRSSSSLDFSGAYKSFPRESKKPGLATLAAINCEGGEELLKAKGALLRRMHTAKGARSAHLADALVVSHSRIT